MLVAPSLFSLLTAVVTVAATATPTLEDLQGTNPRGSLRERGFHRGDLDHTLRTLKAASKRSELFRRDDGITLTDSVSLSYAESTH
jgi:hypothetical protein